MTSIRDVWIHANRIIRAAKQVTNAELKELNLSGAEGSVLLHLSVQGETMSQDQIAEQLDYDKAAVSRAVNVLEERGYVVRQRRSDDRRAYTLSLTDRAGEVVPRIEQIFDRLYVRVLDNMTPDEVGEVIGLLVKISDSLSKA